MLSFNYIISWMFESRMTGKDLMIRIYLFLKKLKKLAGIIEINSWHFMLSVIYSGINSCQSYILAFWTLAEAFRQYCVSNSDIIFVAKDSKSFHDGFMRNAKYRYVVYGWFHVQPTSSTRT